MRIYLSMLAFLLCACSTSEEKITENILPELEFENILKEIHLAEASLEINKNKSIKNTKKKSTAYFDIYKKYHISEEEFKETLNYYSRNPSKLEVIYTNIIEQLNKEKTKFDH